MTDIETRKARGKKIREARIKKGLLQKDIAKMLGKAINTISDYELGKKNINFDDLKLICKILDIDITSL